MPNFSLTMSARQNGETIIKAYEFESGSAHDEEFLIQSYQEFYKDSTDVQILSIQEAAGQAHHIN